ncbi:MAG: response regulator [bacterium]|nr:response regulator [bacterium]
MANIMIVEDEGIVARDIRNRLTKMGHDISSMVDSGERALERLSDTRPDLVLMDIMLKGKLDGIETANQVYRDFHIPVVYLTAHADAGTVSRAKGTEPFGYVVKPFQEQDLKTCIEIALAKHQSEKNLRQSTDTLRQTNHALEAQVVERTANLQEAIDYLNVEINKRKQTQEALQERDEQLKESQRMEAVGRLAGGVAHDFNNQLAVMKGYLDMALETLSDTDRTAYYLNQVCGAVDRAAGLTRQLLLFTSHHPVDPQVIQLNDQINGFTGMLRRLMREDIALELDLETGLRPVFADAVNIDQVVTNLVVNARDAMPKGGRLTIRTRSLLLSQTDLNEHPIAETDQFIHLIVEDTGVGFTEEIKDKIFEPFFTTKSRGEGTGLGLSVVCGIVQAHKGWITAESKPGEGSRFHVYLPSCEPGLRVMGGNRGKPGTSPRGEGERLLVVEDDDQLRDLLKVILEQHGYHVVGCENGKAASHQLAHNGPFQLLLTDVVLPDGMGTDLALEIRKEYPDVATVLMTGYPGAQLDEARIRSAGLRLLQKPIARQQLLNIIYDALREGQ